MTAQHPAAPEAEADANGLTEAECGDLRDAATISWGHLYAVAQRIVAERVRVVEGERDAARVAGLQWCNEARDTREDLESAEQQWIKAQGERDLLAKAIWDVRASFGFDTDGDKRYHSADYLGVARSFIRDMAEALDDLRKEISSADQDGWGRGYDAATARAESAEAAHEAEKAAHERLRAEVEGRVAQYSRLAGQAMDPECRDWLTAFVGTLTTLLGGGEAR